MIKTRLLRRLFLGLALLPLMLSGQDDPWATYYEKSGFVHEGWQRGTLAKDGQRYDMLYMGILRKEWIERNEMRGLVSAA